MGCDIHLIVEHKQDGKWVRVGPPASYERDIDYWLESITAIEIIPLAERTTRDNESLAYYINKRDFDWDIGRNYKLFSILANVRNGYGFAGITTGDKLTPISEPKGLPADCSHRDEYDNESNSRDTRPTFWFGDHSESWLTLKELLAYDWKQTVRCCGVITWREFELRNKLQQHGQCPDSYCGGVSGSGIRTLPEEIALELLKKLLAGTVIDNLDKDSTYVQIWWTQTYGEAAGGFDQQVIPALQSLDSNPENVRLVFGFDS